MIINIKDKTPKHNNESIKIESYTIIGIFSNRRP